MVAVLVGTASFAKLAAYELARRGVVEPRVMLVEHPLGGEPQAVIEHKADANRAELARIVESARG